VVKEYKGEHAFEYQDYENAERYKRQGFYPHMNVINLAKLIYKIRTTVQQDK